MVAWEGEEGRLKGRDKRVERVERLRRVGSGLKVHGRGWGAWAERVEKLRIVGMGWRGRRRQRRVGGRRRRLWRCVGVIATVLLKAIVMYTLRRACDRKIRSSSGSWTRGL